MRNNARINHMGGGGECGIGLNWFSLNKSRLRVGFCENCDEYLCYGRLCQLNSMTLWEGSYRLVGRFRTLRGSQGTYCGCVVMFAEYWEGPSCAIVSCTPHSVLLTPTDNIRLNSPPIIRNSLRTLLTVLTPEASLKLCSA